MRATFEYLRPVSPSDAVKLKAEYGPGAHFWAGGTDISLHWQRSTVHPECCIDLTFLTELDYISVSDSSIKIGAMTSLATLERSDGKHVLLKMLSDITKLMCTPQTRTIATVGGNLCNASPAADLSPALVAINAQVEILGANGRRSIILEDFFVGAGKTCLSDDEILMAVTIPLSGSPVGACYHRIGRTIVDIALVNSATSVTADDAGQITDVRIGLGSVAPVILRAHDAEKVLIGQSLDGVPSDLLEQAGRLAASISKPISDVRASAEYRKAMVVVMTKRALQQSIENLGGAVI